MAAVSPGAPTRTDGSVTYAFTLGPDDNADLHHPGAIAIWVWTSTVEVAVQALFDQITAGTLSEQVTNIGGATNAAVAGIYTPPVATQPGYLSVPPAKTRYVVDAPGTDSTDVVVQVIYQVVKPRGKGM